MMASLTSEAEAESDFLGWCVPWVSMQFATWPRYGLTRATSLQQYGAAVRACEAMWARRTAARRAFMRRLDWLCAYDRGQGAELMCDCLAALRLTRARFNAEVGGSPLEPPASAQLWVVTLNKVA